jgi:HdeA/HdeB family
MRPWLIMFGAGLALIGLQAVQAQVTIDITEITCNQFLGSQITDSRTLGIWLNGYVNGERGKRLIHPPFPRTHQFGELLREPHGHADFGCCPKRFWCRQVVIWHS